VLTHLLTPSRIVRTIFYTSSNSDIQRYWQGATPSWWNTGLVDTYIGEQTGGGGYHYETCVKFNSITVPQGATIDSTDFSCLDGLSGAGTAELYVYGLDEDNGDVPADQAGFEADLAGNLTSAYGYWYISPPGNGVRLNMSASPGGTVVPTAVIQEIVNRPGWVSGNNIVLYFVSKGTGGNDYNRMDFLYTGTQANDPQLTISYKS
jgi:hypothetical protein